MTPPNTLNSNDFPYITGRPARGPISPNPSIAVPSVTIALMFWYPDFLVLDFAKFIKFSAVKHFFSSVIFSKFSYM